MMWVWRLPKSLFIATAMLLTIAGVAFTGNKSMRGTVVAIDEEGKTITVTDSFSGDEKVLKISKATKFYGEKNKLAEIDVVKAGQTVSVMYDPDLGNKVSTFRVMSAGMSADSDEKVAKTKKKKKPAVEDDADDAVVAKKSPKKKEEAESEPSGATPTKVAKIAFPDKGPLKEGALAPNITGNDMDGKAFAIGDYAGKVIVLDFWASY